jgi:hypothetical protein
MTIQFLQYERKQERKNEQNKQDSPDANRIQSIRSMKQQLTFSLPSGRVLGHGSGGARVSFVAQCGDVRMDGARRRM